MLAQGRFGTDRDGYTAMLKRGQQQIAQRLVADGETVLDVPAKLSARARLFDTAQGRKTDPADAHCIGVAALRANGLRQVVVDDVNVALKLLVDRRDELGRARTEALSRLHQRLLDLVPGGAKQFLSAPQVWALLNTARPRDIVGRTRRQLASELITEVAVIDKKIKTTNQQPTELIASTGSTLQHLSAQRMAQAARRAGVGLPGQAGGECGDTKPCCAPSCVTRADAAQYPQPGTAQTRRNDARHDAGPKRASARITPRRPDPTQQRQARTEHQPG
ncbi:transposase [Dactylosporangium sp. NPDC000555]|uniref:IS110 family transposase n=1 Tax=Dactylosporangium sp. NPDC000555 TaxID=3154260 RepID=UPI003332481C